MLNRIYIDNYKCFVDFEFQPQALELWVGGNGTGKTSLFDTLETLRDFVSLGTESSDAFPTRSLTAWATRNEQTFQLGLLHDGSQYQYQLVIQHDRAGRRNRIRSERLCCEERLLYEFDGSDVRWFSDDGAPGASFPFQASRSAFCTIPR